MLGMALLFAAARTRAMMTFFLFMRGTFRASIYSVIVFIFLSGSFSPGSFLFYFVVGRTFIKILFIIVISVWACRIATIVIEWSFITITVRLRRRKVITRVI
jgi:hypothetical protein